MERVIEQLRRHYGRLQGPGARYATLARSALQRTAGKVARGKKRRADGGPDETRLARAMG